MKKISKLVFLLFFVLITCAILHMSGKAVEKTYKTEVETNHSIRTSICIDNFTPQIIDNLELLCRVWGFLKYYHPAVAAGEYNWDAELFRIMPAVVEAPTTDHRNQILSEWISQLGEITDFVDCVKNEEKMIKMFPDLAWIENTDRLSNELVSQLNRIKYAQRTGEHYYVNAHRTNTSFSNEINYAGFVFDDDRIRLLTLFRYWNIIQYFYPYRDLTDKDWDIILCEYIPKFIEVRNERDYKLTILKLFAETNDIQANIYDNAFDKIWGAYGVPVVIRFIEGIPIVIHEFGFPNLFDSGLKKGDIITGIDGVPIKKIIEEKISIIPASNYMSQLHELSHRLLRTDSAKMEVNIIRDGKKYTTTAYTTGTNWEYERRTFANQMHSKLLTHNIGYILPNQETLNIYALSELMESFKNTRGIIIDLRCQPINNEALMFFCNHITNEQIKFAFFSLGSVFFPGQFYYISQHITGRATTDYYQGKIVVIVNEETDIFAELFAMALQKTQHTMVIGSTASTANINYRSHITLPGNINVGISRFGVYYPNKHEVHRVGINIDEIVRPTIKGVIEGQDELLERAVKIVENHSLNIFMLPLFLVFTYRKQRLKHRFNKINYIFDFINLTFFQSWKKRRN